MGVVAIMQIMSDTAMAPPVHSVTFLPVISILMPPVRCPRPGARS
jgi:hypothetical protein